ncbi:MFS transporter [Sphingomonas oleivorans]|uniref:MFS transporter n=1 Tax=Sphingomonas oleivorans TaxID=1735121 RepID=A0A2T5FTQ0_9SPHN|nr:MFS transporter [Sphingomonas oleivorans]PTQ07445.1 MFS transporter [Sphingomonas oleivorans]
MKPNFPLLALSVGAFGIGTTEFAPMGLLPVIATDLGISIPTAGMLVTGYAMGVMVGAPLMTLGTRRIPRQTVLVGLMAIFTIGNLLSALSSSYAMLLGARIVTSLSHGAFFGVGSIVAANLVAPERRASAVATMFMGLTIATIGGVPLATLVGQLVGWRTAFAGITALGALAMLALWFALPRLDADASIDLRHEIGVLTRPPVLRALLTTVLSAGAMFTLLTYIAPILQHETGAAPALVTLMLVVVGVGFTVGNGVGGRFADRSLDGSLIAFLGMLAVLLLIFPFAMHASLPVAVAIFLWGMAAFAVVPPLQMRVMETASDAPSLASSVNVGAFNLGNALGAVVGGGVIGTGLGYAWVPIAGALLSLGGLAIVLFSRRGAAAPDMTVSRASA